MADNKSQSELQTTSVSGNRFVNYDLMRVIACFFVIMIHITKKPFSFPIRVCYTTVLFLSNSIFYMLSGRFNLSYRFESPGDYKKYYSKKFLSILVPYVLISFLLSIWNFYILKENFGLKHLLRFAYTEFMADNSEKALWFMYPLIGFIISAPFLSRLLHALTDRECTILMSVALIWNFVKVFLSTNAGIDFAFSGWILETWVLYFVAGHLITRLINKKNQLRFYLAGIGGFLITVAVRIVTADHFDYSCDYSPAFFLFSIASYYFAEQHFYIKNEYIKQSVSFVAKHTFLIYLLHVHVMRYISPQIVRPDTETVPGYLLQTLCIFICSLTGAVILNLLLIRPLQYLLKKLPFLQDHSTGSIRNE